MLNEGDKYEIEKITKKLKEEKEKAERDLQSWKDIKFVTKKDGTPFKVLSKNIEGAKIRNEYDDGGRSYRKMLYCKYGNDCDWDSYIYLYRSVDSQNRDKFTKTENIIKSEYEWGKEFYIYDLDDIKNEIAFRIEYLEKKKIPELEHQLSVVGEAYEKYYNALVKALETLRDICGGRNDLWCDIKEVLNRRTFIMGE